MSSYGIISKHELVHGLSRNSQRHGLYLRVVGSRVLKKVVEVLVLDLVVDVPRRQQSASIKRGTKAVFEL
jgi:hypothetical protein